MTKTLKEIASKKRKKKTLTWIAGKIGGECYMGGDVNRLHEMLEEVARTSGCDVSDCCSAPAVINGNEKGITSIVCLKCREACKTIKSTLTKDSASITNQHE